MPNEGPVRRECSGDPTVTPYCDHFEINPAVDRPLDVCSACVEIGATWVHLRQCLTCGRTSCCNNSPNRHATAHYRQTDHPMIRSTQPEEGWQWCYPDDRLYVVGPNGYEVAEG